MGGFPLDGENFRTTGLWNITTGRAWFDWKREAIVARRAAAHAAGETFEARRLTAELARFEAGGPRPVDQAVFGSR